jgi:oligopeptide/dipeptide ABC transporter ATP-binding protein
MSEKTSPGDSDTLLRIRDLHVHFDTDAGTVRAVDGVSYDVRRGETLALVGESGCGKSVSSMSILRLVPCPPGRLAGGQIEFEGEDLIAADEARMRALRGKHIAMIFQEPMSSLNPVYTVGDQIAESIILHQGVDAEIAREQTIHLLERVGIPSPDRRIDEYPHQMSGGMCQRVMIALALACNPKLLIADEPSTALDVTIQAQILELMRKIQSESGMSILLITHDLGVVAEMADRVVVMYAGSVVESADAIELFKRPRHPYTAGLFHSIPRLDTEETKLEPIEGNVPDAMSFPQGCKFHPRCRFAVERCRREAPPLSDRHALDSGGSSHRSACWIVDERPDIDLLGPAPDASRSTESSQ